MTISWSSNYPTSLDDFVTTNSLTDYVDEVVANHPNSLATAIQALEVKLGITGDPATGFGGVGFYPVSSDPGPSMVPRLWVDSTSGPGYVLIYQDELNAVHPISLGGSLQMAYNLGNTISASGVGGGVSISVADTEGVDCLTLTQNDTTTPSNCLTLVNNTALGFSLQFAGTGLATVYSATSSLYFASWHGYGFFYELSGSPGQTFTITRGSPFDPLAKQQVQIDSDVTITPDAGGGDFIVSCRVLDMDSTGSSSINCTSDLIIASSGGTNSSLTFNSIATGVNDSIILLNSSVVDGDAQLQLFAATSGSGTSITYLGGDNVTLSSKSVRFIDSNIVSSTWVNKYLELSGLASDWTTLKTNCGGEEWTLIQILNNIYSLILT